MGSPLSSLFISHVPPDWACKRPATQNHQQAWMTQSEKPALSGQGGGRRDLWATRASSFTRARTKFMTAAPAGSQIHQSSGSPCSAPRGYTEIESHGGAFCPRHQLQLRGSNTRQTKQRKSIQRASKMKLSLMQTPTQVDQNL